MHQCSSSSTAQCLHVMLLNVDTMFLQTNDRISAVTLETGLILMKCSLFPGCD